MDSDEEDFVFFGTPIEREEELTSRKKKSVAEAAGQLRTLPPWKQEVFFFNFNVNFSVWNIDVLIITKVLVRFELPLIVKLEFYHIWMQFCVLKHNLHFV